MVTGHIEINFSIKYSGYLDSNPPYPIDFQP